MKKIIAAINVGDYKISRFTAYWKQVKLWLNIV